MKVLVTAASRHGSTRRDRHDHRRHPASVRASRPRFSRPRPSPAWWPIDAVILGSAVYAGQWLEPARAFVAPATSDDDLATRPVFLFSSGPLGYPSRRPVAPADAIAVEMTTGAMDLQVFPGRLVGRDLSLPERLSATKTHLPYGDFRPWDDILDWTREIVRYLHEESVGLATRVGQMAPGDATSDRPSR